MFKSALSFAALSLLMTSATAQYPGQYPGGQNPNGYPGGQGGPLGGGGISLPSRHKKDKKNSDSQKASLPTITAEGVTLTNDGRKLVIATNDGRTITMTITPETKWVRSGGGIAATQIIARTTVRTDAAEDDQAFLTATNVELLKEAPVELPESLRARPSGAAGASASGDEEMAQPTILKNAAEPADHPKLRRGVPKQTQTSDDDDPVVAKNNTPAKPTPAKAAPVSSSGDFTIDGAEQTAAKVNASPSQELVNRTKEWAATFTNGLPNFVCQQSTTRYFEQSRAEGFQAVDLVTAKVVYEDGREEYKEITVGGKKTNKSMMELGGSTSTGEFASVLSGLFTDQSRAEFKFYQSTSISGQAASIYDFKVALHNSNWTIVVGGQSLRPAYSGSVWIDKQTAQVRRIEMQAENVPKDFPEDAIESSVDYEEVSLGTSRFLLPVQAQNLSCQRGSTICSKNTIEFRDYHKYSGESTIEFK